MSANGLDPATQESHSASHTKSRPTSCSLSTPRSLANMHSPWSSQLPNCFRTPVVSRSLRQKSSCSLPPTPESPSGVCEKFFFSMRSVRPHNAIAPKQLRSREAVMPSYSPTPIGYLHSRSNRATFPVSRVSPRVVSRYRCIS
ncbi:hypothetical protein PHLGIDRAFT_170255 [Phlebiopsis gigantea 11061_1 CR5-6]|uniref:Uncharacterized protein n=1 Tax=Phlebiopsis gigantea (strain 11061_1 CR5-6) TaxID=745531 RepID=A0A0C3S4I5_PHLG1|nr:hypothetical protein PHLGIDRAFT_170255 [Phlebiopsis gigantea 11061_1 CR5-6]